MKKKAPSKAAKIIKKQAKKSTNDKKPAKSTPAPKKAVKTTKISKAEASIKNRQQYVNKEVTKAKKLIESIKKQAKGNLNKVIKTKGGKPRKAKTIINEALNIITQSQPELKDLREARKKITKGRYKPRSTNKEKEIPEVKRTKGTRTLGQYHPWQRNDAFDELYSNSSFELFKDGKKKDVEVNTVFGKDRNRDADAWIDELDDTFIGLDSTDVVHIKINTSTGDIFAEVSRGAYGPDSEEE
jgi:hypothetical protein